MGDVVADSDVLIDFLRGSGPHLTFVAELLTQGELVTTAISRFELLAGTRPDGAEVPTDALLTLLRVLPLDAAASDAAAHIDRQLRSAGLRIAIPDTLIAGIAISNRLPLLTRNMKHFERVPGLRLAPN